MLKRKKKKIKDPKLQTLRNLRTKAMAMQEAARDYDQAFKEQAASIGDELFEQQNGRYDFDLDKGYVKNLPREEDKKE